MAPLVSGDQLNNPKVYITGSLSWELVYLRIVNHEKLQQKLKFGANLEPTHDLNAVCDLGWYSLAVFLCPHAFAESLVFSCVELLNFHCVGLDRVNNGKPALQVKLYCPCIVQGYI